MDNTVIGDFFFTTLCQFSPDHTVNISIMEIGFYAIGCAVIFHSLIVR